MEPASLAFFVFVSVSTVAALAATVWSWDWERLRYIRRLTALALTQLMVVLSVLVGINTQEGFFVTWDDALVGAQGANPDARPVVALPPTSALQGAAIRQLDPAVRAAELVVRRRHGGGVMVATAIRGARTGDALPTRLYFPAAYFDKSQPQRVFPVVEFLTGYYGGLDIFQRTLGADRVMDKLIAKGRMPPTVVVIPEQNPHLPADSECVDAVDGDRADTYISLDVPDVVRSELRVSHDRSQWALMGYSTGGYCAANLAIRHPDRFSAAVSLSGYFNAITDGTTGDLYRGNKAARLANSPAHTIGVPRRYPLNFYLATGGGDPDGLSGLKELAAHIKRPDRLTEVVIDKGGHNFGVWRRALPAAFIWIGKTL